MEALYFYFAHNSCTFIGGLAIRGVIMYSALNSINYWEFKKISRKPGLLMCAMVFNGIAYCSCSPTNI